MFDGPLGRVTAAIMARMNAAAEAEAIDELSPAPDARLLVIGFGSGVGLDLLLRRDLHLAITAVDPSSAMHAATRRRLGARVVDVELVQTTAAALTLPTASLDCAVAVHALQLCEPLAATAEMLARTLRPGARVVTITHDWAMAHHAGSADRFLEQEHHAFRAAGFQETEHGFARADRGKAIRFTATR